MKIKNILLACICASMTLAATAVDFKDARVYINPGHGGWGPNDRPMATINYAIKDTMGFFETNTNLRKALSLYHNLKDAGVGYLKMSRNSNGWVLADDEWKTENDQITDESVQIVKLSSICADVEANNIDYFLSIHSNAATEGNSTNYPLLLYRGTDDAVGNGLTYAKQMAQDAWKFINANGITYKSFYQNPGDNNTRGDISFMGGSSTSMGYTGYYGVLKHGADGFLSEGCFHTYQPERHRLLNIDYCYQEGKRYARAIRSWFKDSGEKTGDIMGTVKDKTKPLTHSLYNYKANSMDAYAPLNNVTVILKNADGTKISEYKTDKEYNGVFIFNGLQPGKYILDYSGIEGFWPFSEEIEVKANETSFTNARITPTTEEPPTEEEVAPEVTNYKHPVQDGDIAIGDNYKMAKVGTDIAVEALKDLTIRRSILRDGNLYVLAVDAAKVPKLLVLNPNDGSIVTELSTTGIVTQGYNGKTYPYVLSDIAITDDGIIIGTNSTVIGKENNAYQTGDFYMYKWEPIAGETLTYSAPIVVCTLATNTSASLLHAGNNNSNFMANSIAVNGNLKDFKFYFDSHAGNGWTTNYGMRYCSWSVKDGVATDPVWNDSGSDYTESAFGEDARITLSPLAVNRLVVDGSKIMAKDIEVDQLGTLTKDRPDLKADGVTVETYGANYFRYAKGALMATPVCTPNNGKYDYSINLFDITKGLDKAKLLNKSEVLCTKDAIIPMSAHGVVDNADITEYLMVGNEIFSCSTKGQTQEASPARIYAYDLKQEPEGEGYKLTFSLNETPTEAVVVLTDVETGNEVIRKAVTSPVKGVNTVSIVKADFAGSLTNCNWKVEAASKSVTRFTKISDDNDNKFKFYAPFGVSIDKSPESKYFGRIYVTNTLAGAASGRTTGVGVYVLGSDFSDITTQGDNAYAGGITWPNVAGSGPRKLAIAADGRIFVCDQSLTNSGIYYMNPETFTATSIFPGATRDVSNGGLTIGGTYVAGKINSLGVRGVGEKTQLYAVDATASGSGWKKFVNIYNIGEATTWTTAPNSSKASGSYIGNDNNSIQPVSTGFWAAQYRGGGSNSSANPCLFYVSDAHNDAVWDSATPVIINESSQNGAMAVKENEGLIALSVNGGLAVYSYKLDKEKLPKVTELFRKTLEGQGTYINDFEFDYAGNLYAVSNVGERLGAWAMPTSDNRCITPAKRDMIVTVGLSGVEDIVDNAQGVVVSPNPATDIVNIQSGEAINTINIYAISSGSLVEKVAGNGSNTTTVDVSNLAAGVYLVKVNNAPAVKLIKK